MVQSTLSTIDFLTHILLQKQKILSKSKNNSNT